MKDNEYYHSLEDWPQPPDEKPTLEVPYHTHRKSEPKPQKRRKLSQSLGGLFVGAVAVVMAVSIITEKDFFNDYDGYEPVDQDGCLICGKPDCPYWDEYYRCPRITISIDNDNAIFGTETYEQMQGKDDAARDYTRSECLYTPDGVRLFLSLEPRQMPVGVTNYSVFPREVWNNPTGAFPVQDESVASLRFQLEGLSPMARGGVEEEENGNLLLQLLYSPNDTVPEEGFSVSDEDWTYCATIPYSGADHVWIRAYSTISQELCDTALEYCKVDALYGDGLSYALGQTMWLTENDKVGRLWLDETIGGIYVHTIGKEQDCVCYGDIHHRIYSVWSGNKSSEISVTHGAIFTQFMEQWMELNEDLPKNGHVEFYHLKELQTHTHNGITYRVYITWNDGLYESARVFLIPEQEQNISISFDFMEFEYQKDINRLGSLQELLDQSETLNDQITSLLQQITLRNSAGSDVTPPTNPVTPSGPGDNSTIGGICGEEDCPYCYGLRLDFPNETIPYVDELDIMHMDGSVLTGTMQNGVSEVLNTQDGKRLMLEMNPKLLPFSAGLYGQYMNTGDDFSVMHYSFDFVTMNDGVEYGSAKVVFLLTYGRDSLNESEIEKYGPYHTTVPVSNVAGAWLHVFSDISQEFSDDCAKAICVHSLDAKMTYRLGDTMIFRESAEFYRNWGGGVNSVKFHSEDSLHIWLNETDAHIKFDGYFFSNRYPTISTKGTVSLVYYATPFPQIAQQWIQRNEAAQDQGHSVVLSIKQLQVYTVNGITYDVYAGWYQTIRKMDEITLFMIPRQESNIAVLFSMETSHDSWQTLDELLAAAGEKDFVNAMLSQIELYH